MEVISLHFFHGFLGKSTDWRAVESELNRLGLTSDRYQFSFWNLNEIDYLSTTSIEEAADLFLSKNQLQGKDLRFIGYSMGGRFALELSKKRTDVQQLILVSTNLGLQPDHEEQKAIRKVNDQKWATDFLHQSWQDTVQRWNQQPVFVGSRQEPNRIEADYDKNLLAHQLQAWSLSNQKSHWDYVLQNSKRIQCIVGQNDLKLKSTYTAVAEAKTVKPWWSEVADSGHRILFDQPERLAERLAALIQGAQ